MLKPNQYLHVVMNVTNACDWIVGGWENSYSDGSLELHDLPTFNELIIEIQNSLRSCSYIWAGMEIGKPDETTNRCDDSFLEGMIASILVNMEINFIEKRS